MVYIFSSKMECKLTKVIFVLVLLTLLLLLEVMLEVKGAQMAETSLEMHTTGRIACNHNLPYGSFDTARWTKSANEDIYENGGGALVAWIDGEGVTSPNPDKYDMIDTDLSLVIKNVSLEDAGIYRCTVFPSNHTVKISDSDNKLSVYKQPDYPPVLTYHIQGGKIIFNCSVGTIFPLNYPEFPFPYQNNHTVLNEDGTYMTSVSAAFQYDGSGIQVECSYSYRNQHWHSSLTIYGDDRDAHAMTTESGSKSSKYSTELSSTKGQNHLLVRMEGFNSILWLLILILLLLLVDICNRCLFACFRRWKNKEGTCWSSFLSCCRRRYQGEVKGDKKDVEFFNIDGTAPPEKKDPPAGNGISSNEKQDIKRPEKEDSPAEYQTLDFLDKLHNDQWQERPLLRCKGVPLSGPNKYEEESEKQGETDSGRSSDISI